MAKKIIKREDFTPIRGFGSHILVLGPSDRAAIQRLSSRGLTAGSMAKKIIKREDFTPIRGFGSYILVLGPSDRARCARRKIAPDDFVNL